MPDAPKFAKTGPPPGRGALARAKGSVTPDDAPDVIASTEPDDDLSDYIVPPDPDPVPASPPAAPAPVPVEKLLDTDDEPVEQPVSKAVTTADTELVLRLEQELAQARARLSGKQWDPSTWATRTVAPEVVDGQSVLIHIREDGFTACGRVWYRGQELEFTVGQPNWEDTKDIKGNSWVLQTESDQLRRYGRVMFGLGPWPGSEWDNASAASAEARRGRAAPSIPHLSSNSLER
jgi:hypothetical protein